jgi:hypothetical protein
MHVKREVGTEPEDSVNGIEVLWFVWILPGGDEDQRDNQIRAEHYEHGDHAGRSNARRNRSRVHVVP